MTSFQGDRVGAPPKHDLVHKFINPCKKNPDKGREGTTNSDDVVHEGPTEKKTIIGSSFEGSFGFFYNSIGSKKKKEGVLRSSEALVISLSAVRKKKLSN